MFKFFKKKNEGKISVGSIVCYKGVYHKVEYVGYFKGMKVVQLDDLNGLVPAKEVGVIK